jgi:subtilisin family serine protease
MSFFEQLAYPVHFFDSFKVQNFILFSMQTQPRTFFAPVALVFAMMVTLSANAQRDAFSTVDSLNAKQLNWQHKTIKDNKTVGIGTTNAYNTLLANQQPKQTVVVAVIDAGVDIFHEDLQGKIWTNTKEIPDNGIDDDKNGYIDDVHGWNFLGSANGENVNHENLEYTRIIKKYKPVFEGIDTVSQVADDQKANYLLYKKCQATYDAEVTKNQTRLKNIEGFEERLAITNTQLKKYFGTDSVTLDQVKAIKTKDKQLKAMKELYLMAYSSPDLFKAIKSMKDHINESMAYNLNLEFSARESLGDNLDDLNDRNYGNNNVKGPDSFHGTFVAGVIAANRNNNKGIDGIAENVQIMSVRAVPNGDETDKDIALAIMYAVDNGAKVINMSFGKAFSPNKPMVDQAIRYAEEKGVLLVHAAGNEAQNVDVEPRFPTKHTNDGKAVSTWVNVGASTGKKDKTLPAVFSNFGQTDVDLFAPGADVISLTTENRYMMADGTSFACPMVAGVAALVWSYYPNLTANQIKEVLLKSVTPLPKLKVDVPVEGRPKKKEQAKFGTLSQTGGVLNAYEALKLAATY